MANDRRKKQYRFPPGGFLALVPSPWGEAGCVISDRITVGGESVGQVYRDGPAHPGDSGWAILSGNETEEELADPSRHDVWSLNEAANFDRRLIPLFDSPQGSAFVTDPLTSMLVPYHPLPEA